MRTQFPNKLPPQLPGNIYWPRTKENSQMTDTMPDGRPWPRVSIVTPSYNQGQYLEECIRSVLSQDYPNLEHIIIDGGSTDNSVEIIRQYEKSLTYWVSEDDEGPHDAINKGFKHTTGEILAWLNSDDKFMPWTLRVVAEIFSSCPEVEWLTSLYPIIWDERGLAVQCASLPGFDRRAYFKGGTIQQESTFWRQSLWERAGAYIDTSFEYAFDRELWGRFWQHAELYGVGVPLGGNRQHDDRFTNRYRKEYNARARAIDRRYGGRHPGKLWVSLRRFLRVLRPFSTKLPKWFHNFLPKLGFYRGKVIDHQEGEWRIRDSYFM
jgi:glycosyltransferase involved in cell wall biosynthesis